MRVTKEVIDELNKQGIAYQELTEDEKREIAYLHMKVVLFPGHLSFIENVARMLPHIAKTKGGEK